MNKIVAVGIGVAIGIVILVIFGNDINNVINPAPEAPAPVAAPAVPAPAAAPAAPAK
jgi:ribosomal protein L12E/L44/L45/RPP1/RPP2